MKRTNLIKKIISVVIVIALITSYMPAMLSASAAEASPYNRVVDPPTMDGWRNYFDTENLDTSNAGGVWTDKSVFTDAEAFPNSVTMLDGDKNFLTALSALAANKEIVGYSTVPTDTVFVLDLSQSMTSQNMTDLVKATNEAIKQLQSINNNNRVGVVLYSGATSYNDSVTRLLPIDRYTTTRNDGNFINLASGRVSIYSGVSGTKPLQSVSRAASSGGTYIQAGLFEAWKMFSEIPDNDIYIGKDNWQEGEYRMPIVVLMTDGGPTRGSNTFDNVGNSNVGNGYPYGIREGDAFLVQLTASYVKNRIENKYKVKENYGAGRGLFYTLGFNISASGNPNTVNDNNIAYSVVNPDGTTLNDAYWASYNNNSSIQVTVTGTSGMMSSQSKQVTVTKNSYATSKSYVDEYFPASGNGLSGAFNEIVEEIVLQSRYYPTHLEGGSPDFSGYVTFTDTLGEYMEVKDVKGILLGEAFYSGQMMASKISDNSLDGLGTPENPTLLGQEFIRAARMRLGITDANVARELITKAYAAKQIYYKDKDNWSNYIAWYAKADGSYAGFYDEVSTNHPADAVYINRSYAFLGETVGSIKNSDMMYMSVQIHTHIETGKETVIWKIPAALVPTVTYNVELDGKSINNAKNVRISLEDAENVAPIRLIYETGLRSDLNEFNITRVQGYSIDNNNYVTDERHIAADYKTRLFWNNSYDISGNDHTKHKVALAEFTPNKENERFYYTFDSAVYKAVGNSYELVGENEILDENGTYYHRRYIFTEESTNPIFRFEKMSAASVRAAKANGWQADFATIDNRIVGAWAVPMGTPARELQMYSAEKADEGEATKSAHMIFYPYLVEQNEMYYVDMNLGNNGLLSVTPATGLKISKTVDIFEPGTSDTFRFRITAAVNGSFEGFITALDETPSGEGDTVTFRNGVYEFSMKRDQTFWLSGLAAGTTYTVEEISDNDDYKIKSVHINGNSTGKTAYGTIAEYLIDDVQFVNTAVGEGDLVITKEVVDAAGNKVDVSNNIKFTAEVTLTDTDGNPVSGTFESTNGTFTVPANGVFTVTLTEGESFVLRGIPEETRYTVAEKNIPSGFSLNAAASRLTGVVDNDSNDHAVIVNTYAPTAVRGDGIAVEIIKTISGSRTSWLSGEAYSFKATRNGSQNTYNYTISDTTANHKTSFTLQNEVFTEAGTYNFSIEEVKGAQGGITYDTVVRSFAVVVADDGMDGDLDIISVENRLGTTVSGEYLVSANFNNVYAPTGSAEAVINIEKFIDGHSKSGYQFALYDANPENGEAEEIICSGLTAADGKAKITLNFSAADAGNTYKYYLAEIGRGQRIKNIQYSSVVYKLEITVKDNLDGTVSAEMKVDGATYSGRAINFTNVYVPSASDFVTITGQKKIKGDRALNAGEFSFNISAVTAGAPMPSVTTVQNDANGFFAFSEIEFGDSHKNKTFVYEVKENSENPIGGFTYDESVYTVTVTVTDNGTTVKATPVITLPNASASDIVFENEYNATPATLTLGGTKLLTGKKLTDSEFLFVIERVTAGAPMPLNDADVNTVRNDASGNINFGTFTFTKKGTYIYKLYEQDGGDPRYEYDKSVYNVTVTVTDNSEGKLSASYKLSKDGADSSEIVFRNGFTPAAISYDIYTNFGGEKTLEGRPLAEGEFSFVLINAVNGRQIGDPVKNDADGKIAFPAVTIPAEGTYHFKIQEVHGDEKGISYDATVYHVVVGVAQQTSGDLVIVRNELHRATTIKDEVGGVPTEITKFDNITDGGSIEFINTYKADPTEVILSGKKVLTGRKLGDGEFKFNLYSAVLNGGVYEKGELLEQTVNDADGGFEFATRTANESGTTVYIITEDATEKLDGVTYDETVYLVAVTATDNLNGTLSVSYEIKSDGEAADEIVFENVYTAPTVPVPETGDNSVAGLWMLISLAFISGAVMLLTGKSLLGKE